MQLKVESETRSDYADTLREARRAFSHEVNLSTLESQEPVTIFYQAFLMRDEAGDEIEFEGQRLMPRAVVEKAKIDMTFCGKILSSICLSFQEELLSLRPWVCFADGCQRKATQFVQTPRSFLHSNPPSVADLHPIPTCGRPECVIKAKKEVQSVMRQDSRMGGPLPDGSRLYDKKLRRCANCEKGEPDGIQMSKCSRCKVVYYCNRDCQMADWKMHKKRCVHVP
jgi:hypothetical protein